MLRDNLRNDININSVNTLKNNYISKDIKSPNVKLLINKFNNANKEFINKKRHYSDGALILNNNKTATSLVDEQNNKNNQEKHLCDIVVNDNNIESQRSTRIRHSFALRHNSIKSGVFYSRRNSNNYKYSSGSSFYKENYVQSRLKGPVNNYQSTKDIFVYRVAEGSIDDVKDYCSRKDINIIEGSLIYHVD